MGDKSTTKSSTRSMIILIVAISVTIFALGFFALGMPKKIMQENMCNKGIDYLENGEYDKAIEIFDELRDEKNYEGLMLGYYANYLRCKGTDLAKEKIYLDNISDYYNGKLADTIAREKKSLKKRCEEQFSKLKEEADKDPYKYKDVIPFEGMSIFYIDRTYMGKPYKLEKSQIERDGVYYDRYKYTWCTSVGQYLLMDAICIDYVTECVVTNITIYNRFLWENGLPDLSGRSYVDDSSSSGKSSGKSYKYNYNYPDDDYNVYDYSDYEDFYYDYSEDFDGLDDAEDYYNDAWEDYDY